jgi:glutamate racemase
MSISFSRNGNAIRIAFIDSGFGGLIFCLRLYHYVKSFINNVNYHGINIEFIHIGDVKNSPYGNKKLYDIANLSNKLINYAKNLNCEYIYPACNTMCTAAASSDYFEPEFRDVSRHLIFKSSSSLYKSAVKNAQNNDIVIALWATQATLDSKVYQVNLRKIHQSKFPEKTLHIIEHSYPLWVTNIDSGNGHSADAINNVMQDIAALFRQKTLMRNVAAVGLFCTHYPTYERQILSAIYNCTGRNVALLRQEQLFVRDFKNIIDKKTANITERCEMGRFTIRSILNTNLDTDKLSRIVNFAYGDEIAPMVQFSSELL